MKGSLHTDELMGAVVAREGGIRTERRISHCFIMDVPGHAAAAHHHRRGGEHRPRPRRQGRHHSERHRSRACDGRARGARSDPERDGDGDGEGAVHNRSRRLMQDGGPWSDHGSAARRAARARQCDQPGGGGDQEDRIPRRRTRERARRSGSRGRQHARQEPVVPRQSGRRRDCARGARADHSDEPGRLASKPPRLLAPSRLWSRRRGASRRLRPFIERRF